LFAVGKEFKKYLHECRINHQKICDASIKLATKVFFEKIKKYGDFDIDSLSELF